MENFKNKINSELLKGIKVDDKGQTELDFEAASSLQQEEIEKEDIIKRYPVLRSECDLLNKKEGKWFVGEVKLESWLDEKRREEREDDLSYLDRYRRK
jgi:hypothetical protein